MTAKKTLRKKIRAAIEGLAPEVRKIKSRKIAARLSRMSEYKAARSALFFVSRQDEPDTRGLMKKAIASGMKVYAPRVSGDTLEAVRVRDTKVLAPGAYGICEPPRPRRRPSGTVSPDVILVPGVAFDERGARLGRGKGYYDGFLAAARFRGKIVGLIFDEFLFKRIPERPRDARMSAVVTDKRVLRFS